MTLKELGNKLREMYTSAPKGEAVAMIHLFGIMYANEIQNSKFSNKEIVDASGISKSYFAELAKGVKLSNYVTLKQI